MLIALIRLPERVPESCALKSKITKSKAGDLGRWVPCFICDRQTAFNLVNEWFVTLIPFALALMFVLISVMAVRISNRPAQTIPA